MGKCMKKITALLLCLVILSSNISAAAAAEATEEAEAAPQILSEPTPQPQPPENPPAARDEAPLPETVAEESEEDAEADAPPEKTDDVLSEDGQEVTEEAETTDETEDAPAPSAETAEEPSEETETDTEASEEQTEEEAEEDAAEESEEETEAEATVETVSCDAPIHIEITSLDGGLPAGTTVQATLLSDVAGEYIHESILSLTPAREGYFGTAVDIKLLLEGRELDLEGRRVQVTLSGIPGVAAGSDLSVYHLPQSSASAIESDAAAFAARLETGARKARIAAFAAAPAAVHLSARADQGSVSFTTDGFSVYYILAGNTTRGTVDNNVIAVNSGTNNTIYVAPGTVVRFQRTESNNQKNWRFDSGKADSVTATVNGRSLGTGWYGGIGSSYASATVSISPSASPGDTAVLRSSRGAMHQDEGRVTIVVRPMEELIASIRTDSQYPIYLTVIRNSTAIPGEPSIATGGAWRYFPTNYGTPTTAGVTFASSGASYIPALIASDIGFISSYDGTNTMGVADASGGRTLAALRGAETAFDWDRVMEGMWNYESSDRGTILGDGTSLYAYRTTHTFEQFLTEYKVYPYVIKIQTVYSLGWHIDCCIVKRDQVRLNYDLNIPAGYSFADTNVSAPSGVSLYPGTSTVVNPGNSSNLRLGDTRIVTDETGREYRYTFLGWFTNTSRTPPAYQTGDTITITRDTTLYAGWDTPEEVRYTATALPGDGIASTEGSAEYPYDALVEFRAQLEPGWQFTGWYDGETLVSEETTYSFRMPRQDVELEARAVRNTTTLILSKTGMVSGESAIFSVTGPDVNLTVSVVSGQTVTISGLTIGQRYTVTEHSGWSWRYSGGGSKTVLAEESGSSVSFANSSRGFHWRAGETVRRNLFNAG